jgi:uncharacterized membrane protein YcaP (DUF421 family)
MGHTSYVLVIVKTVGLYALALLMFRLMGKRALGDMEPLDFVVVIAIAEILGAPLADPALSLWPPIVAIVALTLLQIGLAYLSLSSARVQAFLEGKPIVVIREGRVLARNLRRARVSPGELAERLRERGFLGPADVELAVFETDGMLSAIPKREASPVTPRFLGLESSTTLVLEGQPVPAGLRKAGVTQAELFERLSRRGLSPADAEEVFIDPDGRLRVIYSLTPNLPKTKPLGASRDTPRPDGSGRRPATTISPARVKRTKRRQARRSP